MAGRGVDILLGGSPEGLIDEYLRGQGLSREQATEGQLADALNAARSDCERDGQQVRDLGGLHIIGTERHEARRIDNQLRGRAGRQGDPGSSRFYLSLQDELMRRFGGPNIADLMSRFGMQDNVPIEHDLVTKAIENAQTRVEGHNFDLRKHVVEYDDVVNKQRAIIYSERHKVLSDEDLRSVILKMADEVIDELVQTHTVGNDTADWDLETLSNSVAAMMPTPDEFSPDSLAPLSRDELNEYLKSIANWAYETREVDLGSDMMRQAERLVLLNVIDRNWVGHLTAIDELRQGIGLRAYGQRDPLVEYKSEAFNMFQGLLAGIRQEVVHAIFHVALQSAPAPQRNRRPSTNISEDGGAMSNVSKKVGRNHPCPCGSGKKYKRCHGRVQR
jgi:preprotein translocase subunit SecA